MGKKLVSLGLAALLSACSAPKPEPSESLEEKAKWEYYGGKVNYDNGLIEGGYLDEMHHVANLSLGMAKSAESFEYDGSTESFDWLIRYGMQAEFAAKNIKAVYDEREKTKEKFPDSWDERINFSFQLVLNKFVNAYDTLNSAWKKSDEKIVLKKLSGEQFDLYDIAKSHFSNACLIMRMYRDVATQVKVRLPEELASRHQRER